MPGGTLTRADLYGEKPAQRSAVDVLTPSSRNQGSVAQPQNAGTGAVGVGAAASWVGFILLLVAWRVAIELGGKAD